MPQIGNRIWNIVIVNEWGKQYYYDSSTPEKFGEALANAVGQIEKDALTHRVVCQVYGISVVMEMEDQDYEV